MAQQMLADKIAKTKAKTKKQKKKQKDTHFVCPCSR